MRGKNDGSPRPPDVPAPHARETPPEPPPGYRKVSRPEDGGGARTPDGSASAWREGAAWTDEAPVPPADLRRRARRRRMKRSQGVAGVARFFTKQALWFVALAFTLLVVDLILYMLITTYEMDRSYHQGTPATLTRTASDQLSFADGAYALGDEAAALLDEQGAWAQLVAADGTVAWSRNVPEATGEADAAGTAGTEAEGGGEGDAASASENAAAEAGASENTSTSEPTSSVTVRDSSDPRWGTVPSHYTLTDIALLSHYHAVNGFPAFIWERDDGLLIVGFPPGSYETTTFTFTEETGRAIPGYIMGVLGLDLLILFAAYLMYRRRTQRAVRPITDALDVLSHGGRVELNLKGDLQPIADQINETSDVLEHKDSARTQWIRGVSHDIRTPLSLIIAKADGIASQEALPADSRADARAIRTQGLKIKDLVADLNAASQLAFDTQPLNLQRIHLPKFLRDIAATYLNSGLDDNHPLEFSLADGAGDAMVLGDERLLARLVENLLTNARLHNEQGCRVRMSLEAEGASAVQLRVEDDGVGMTAHELAQLELRLSQARIAPDDAVPDDAGHGLGLVLIDRIARAHGGTLRIASEPGKGFSATVSLPLA